MNNGNNTVEIIDRGLKCLSDHLGENDTEIFIATILKERFDYTKWRRKLVDEIQTYDDLQRLVEKPQIESELPKAASVVL